MRLRLAQVAGSVMRLQFRCLGGQIVSFSGPASSDFGVHGHISVVSRWVVCVLGSVHFFHCLGGQIVPFSGVWFAPSRSV